MARKKKQDEDEPKSKSIDPASQYQDAAWWNAHTRDMAPHDLLVTRVTNLRSAQSVRYENMRRLNAIYEWGFRDELAMNETSERPLREDLNTYNAAQNMLDTVHAKVCKNQVLPMPITDGGSYSEQRRARNLGKAIEGVFDENKVDQLKEDVFYDGLICGAGFAKVYAKNGKVQIDWVQAEDITVDDNEGRYRLPRTIHERQRMDRFVALEAFGGTGDTTKDLGLYGDRAVRREKILSCKSWTDLAAGSGMVHHDQIEVHEAWHLPSAPGAGDGRHVIAIDGCTLVDEEYCCDHYHFSIYRPRKRRRSFWGLSGMSALAPSQKEYEKLTQKLQRAVHRQGGSHILAAKDSVDIRELDNDEGTLVEFTGNVAPQTFNTEPASPVLFQYRGGIPADMAQHFGISQMSTSSQVPAGLSQASGKALQVFEDQEDGRLRPYYAEGDRWHVELAQLTVCTARGIVEAGDDYKVNAASRKGLDTVDWKEVLIDEGKYVLRIYATNGLAKQPTARFEQLQEMFNSQSITAQEWKKLSGIPDLEASNDMDTADQDIIDMALDKMIMTGVYTSPEPFDNLQLAAIRAGKFVNLMRQRTDVPRERIVLVHQYSVDADRMAQEAAAKNAPPPGAAPPMPGGPPMGAPPPPQLAA